MLDRRSYIGGSDIGRIAGLSPYGGPLDVWLEKTGRATPRRRPKAQQGKLDWGSKLELLVLEELAARTGMVVTPNRGPDGEQKTFQHPGNKWFAGTPDGWANQGSYRDQRGHLVEAKTAGGRTADRWGQEGSDCAPDEYLAQAAWYMEILDVDHTHLPVLFDGYDFKLFELPRDRAFGAALLALGERFVQDHIETGLPPPAQTPEERLALQAGLFPRDIKSVTQSTPELDALVLELRDLRRSSQLGSQRELELRATLVEAIQDSAGLEGDWGIISYKRNRDSLKTDWEAVAREMFARHQTIPDLAELVIKNHTMVVAGARPFAPRFK